MGKTYYAFGSKPTDASSMLQTSFEERIAEGQSDYYEPDISVKVHYVHELQHALRLCGLNDLADNFKIKEV